MLNFTPLVRPYFISRLHQQLRYKDYADAIQQGELVKLIERAALTTFGRKYDFSSVRTYREYAARVPLHNYEDLLPLIMRMVHGESGVLWPGLTLNFAQSSGTMSGKSKYIPITPESLRRNHYQGASDVMSHYLNLNPDSRLWSGKALILGGSFANELNPRRGVKVGDLSATLISNMNPLANLFRVPSKKIALMENWEEKLPLLIDACKDEDVTNLSGVPSWFLTVLTRVMEAKGASSIHEVWPNLEVFFHGGIAFEPYRKQYERICDMSRMHFLDTYNASEGFFAVQSDWESKAMLLLLDVGIFYEFLPLDQAESDNARALPVWEVEAGKTYELIISSCNGLWRYRLGDTVTVAQTRPLKITIAGRTKSFINAFGEEVMVHNTDHAIVAAAHATGAEILNYTVAPVYAHDEEHGHHQWLIEFAREPQDRDAFMRIIDEDLKQHNSDYEAKRKGNIFLDMPHLTIAQAGLFDRWLATRGKLGGQRKIPRLSNNRDIIEQMLGINATE